MTERGQKKETQRGPPGVGKRPVEEARDRLPADGGPRLPLRRRRKVAPEDEDRKLRPGERRPFGVMP